MSKKNPDKRFVVKIYQEGGFVSNGLYVLEQTALDVARSAKDLAIKGVTTAYQIKVYDIEVDKVIYLWNKPIKVETCF